MTVWKQVGIVVVFTLGVHSHYSPALAAEDKKTSRK
jgi:hypothetical protein